MNGLEALDIVGANVLASSLVVSTNAALTSIAALGAISELVASVVISDNPELTSMSGLGGLVTGSGITVTGNDALTTFGAFAELVDVQNLTLAANMLLESVELPALTDATSINVTTNAALESIELSALTTAGGITIASNMALTDIGTLEALTDVDSLLIAGNPMLPQCFVDALDARLQACTACQGNDTTAVCN